MAVARSIFTLDGGFQLFCAAFDMPVTGVPLEVALGYKKIVFWEFQKNNHEESLDGHLCDYYFEMPKDQIFQILKQLLMAPLSWADQKLPKTIEPTHLN